MATFKTVLVSLRRQKTSLESQLSRINAAIGALAGISSAPKKRQTAKKAAKKRTRKPMSAAAKKVLSARMKKYWAAKKRK